MTDLIVGASRQKGCSSENHTAQPYTRAASAPSPTMRLLGKLRQAAQCCRKEFWVSSWILLGGWFPQAHWEIPSLTVIAAEVSSDQSCKNKYNTAEGGRLLKLWFFYRKIEKWTKKKVSGQNLFLKSSLWSPTLTSWMDFLPGWKNKYLWCKSTMSV